MKREGGREREEDRARGDRTGEVGERNRTREDRGTGQWGERRIGQGWERRTDRTGGWEDNMTVHGLYEVL